MIDIDENGNRITEDDIKRWVNSAEKLDFSEFKDVSDCIYGNLEPLSEEKTTISFTLPVSTDKQLSVLAKKQNCTKSDILRAFVFDGLLRTS